MKSRPQSSVRPAFTPFLARQYEQFGYAKLWDYCAGELRLQPGQIFRRTNAARLIRRFPDAIEYILAVAMGGTSDLENLRLLCRAHNQLHARQTFGAEYMERAAKPGSR